MKKIIAALTVGLTLLMTANRSEAVSITLYDGASNVTPDQYNSPSPWLTFTSLFGGTQGASGGVTNLDTSTNNITYAGYSNYSVNAPTTPVNPLFPGLDRNAGYTLSFTVRINSQVNDGTNGANRAGFSVIVLSSDKQGIELGFRNNVGFINDDIFAQNNSSFNGGGEQNTGVSALLGSLTTYDLNVFGSSYTLSNGANSLLTGSLRDYTAATGLGSQVYNTPNFIFLGDDTTSARANIDLANVSITVPDEVPEPSTIPSAVLLVGGFLVLKKKYAQLAK
ncbi:PEP-CTERM putative exosortase interaction domain-containing protein [Cylindrospermum stagnale PCC 7417]|uniref:PEP-CTERM putative exosortase interaction domain-containing protein n=1 Tax=Cylindrospermum stagnale PCC 7417 TaxID=56107 RepID=K9X4H5_9NOST|nr:PEP-CTERM sorting domain-containing protein [Cylindrospermum stagnale]AFZ26966.1 PEP-CTERM putative exosortase interaction domain-containing protein [Cylindrospermum stagnale PCC 7417]